MSALSDNHTRIQVIRANTALTFALFEHAKYIPVARLRPSLVADGFQKQIQLRLKHGFLIEGEQAEI
ncbi:MAG: hypothetical protein D6B27_10575 [Gammaproteobacteria bacterium]|nr:MAG: hypothetical protein D6B27_10575 [Gammaproteobacteria bacterium]